MRLSSSKWNYQTNFQALVGLSKLEFKHLFATEHRGLFETSAMSLHDEDWTIYLFQKLDLDVVIGTVFLKLLLGLRNILLSMKWNSECETDIGCCIQTCWMRRVLLRILVRNVRVRERVRHSWSCRESPQKQLKLLWFYTRANVGIKWNGNRSANNHLCYRYRYQRRPSLWKDWKEWKTTGRLSSWSSRQTIASLASNKESAEWKAVAKHWMCHAQVAADLVESMIFPKVRAERDRSWTSPLIRD